MEDHQAVVAGQNDENWITHDEFCNISDEFCIKNDEFCIKTDGFGLTNDEFCIINAHEGGRVLSVDAGDVDDLAPLLALHDASLQRRIVTNSH